MNRVKQNYSLLVCWLFLAFVVAVTIAGGKWKKHTVLKSDAAGYYAYLPATFIYKDLFGCSFYPYVDSVYKPGDGVVYYAVQRSAETGKVYFKYNYGVATFELPLFLVAHLYVKATGGFAADGYTAPYQLAVALSTVLFSFLGLLLLRRFLLNWFGEIPVAITLAIIGFGTNYLAQVITQPGISHVYMFFLYAVIMYYTQRLFAQGRLIHFCGLILALAMVPVTRGSGLFIVLFPLLWRVNDTGITQSIITLWQRYKLKLALVLLTGAVVVFLQLLYWKLSSGHWYFYTYRREYFDFSNSQIVNGLFSYRKGWFVYTPLALLGFAGLVTIYKRSDLRFYLLPFALYIVATVYVVFSWWQWYYGGSFGCRVMVESLVLLALPIAGLFERVLNLSKPVKFISGSIIGIFILLNIFQTYQYAKGIIHWQKMNKAYYWQVFGKLQASEEDKKLLEQTEELNTNNSPRL